MLTRLTPDELVTVFSGVPPLELLGVELLRQFRTTGGLFPAAPPDCVIEATVQLLTYTRECAETVRKLGTLPPVPLVSVPCEEFPL
jgi:hypothetical protein